VDNFYEATITFEDGSTAKIYGMTWAEILLLLSPEDDGTVVVSAEIYKTEDATPTTLRSV
jgi:hypothetical protein